MSSYLGINPVFAMYDMNFKHTSGSNFITGSHCQGFIPRNDYNWIRDMTKTDVDKKYPLIYSTLRFPYDGASAVIDFNGHLNLWIIGGRDDEGQLVVNTTILLKISDWKENVTQGIYRDYSLQSPAFTRVLQQTLLSHCIQQLPKYSQDTN